MFKVGDKIICIDASNCRQHLQVNIIYTVSKMFNIEHVYLQEDRSNTGWYSKRFKLRNPCEDILQGILDE